MTTTIQDQQASVGTEQVWRALAKASFAVISQVTAAGEPRSSGVLYKATGQRLYVAVGADSWKARQLTANPRVAATVPVRRGGILSLLAPIPPATISFHGAAIVHPADSPAARSLIEGAGLPAAARAAGLGLHRRGRPRGRLPHLRPGRLPAEAARPGRVSRPRAGRVGGRPGDERRPGGA
jgi:Pyridoxamine 5'-phosphate oxidase